MKARFDNLESTSKYSRIFTNVIITWLDLNIFKKYTMHKKITRNAN